MATSYTFDLDEPWERWREQLDRLIRELEGARLRDVEVAGIELGLPWPLEWTA
jgi:hypothetical protein